MRGDILLLLNTPSWRGSQLKHRDNFTFLPLPYTFTAVNMCTTLELNTQTSSVLVMFLLAVSHKLHYLHRGNTF